MTHFVTLIIVPRAIYLQGQEAIDKYIEKVMEQYDENLEVTPYIYLTKAQFEEKYRAFKTKTSGRSDVLKYDTIDKYRTDYCGHDLVDHEGNILSTYNQKCIWDWYCIGGRWDGELTEPDAKCENSINVASFMKLDREKRIYSHIVDQHGVLHQDRKMWWFGSSSQVIDDDLWMTNFDHVLSGAPDDFIVSLDCHI
jgi:hypothetical protein